MDKKIFTNLHPKGFVYLDIICDNLPRSDELAEMQLLWHSFHLGWSVFELHVYVVLQYMWFYIGLDKKNIACKL